MAESQEQQEQHRNSKTRMNPSLSVPIVKEPSPEPESEVDGHAPGGLGGHTNSALAILEPSGSSLSPPGSDSSSASADLLDVNNVEVIDDLSVNRWLMRVMRLGATYTSTDSNGYGRTTSMSSGSSSSRSTTRRLSVTADVSAANLLRPPNTSRGRRFSDSINLGIGQGASTQNPLVRLQKPSRKGKKSG